jgi:hypothetical protein
MFRRGTFLLSSQWSTDFDTYPHILPIFTGLYTSIRNDRIFPHNYTFLIYAILICDRKLRNWEVLCVMSGFHRGVNEILLSWDVVLPTLRYNLFVPTLLTSSSSPLRIPHSSHPIALRHDLWEPISAHTVTHITVHIINPGIIHPGSLDC